MIDKELHFALSGAVFIADYGVRRIACGQRPVRAMALAARDAFIVGGMKEAYDAVGHTAGLSYPYAGDPDVHDLLFDIYGIASASGLALLAEGTLSLVRRHNRRR